jgi:outer membrane protein assembly factor BamB
MLGIIPLLLLPDGIQAQAQCGEVQRIRFPIDTTLYELSQNFGASSQRHQGRYHTGEDWHGERGNGYGQPVYAIAAGRVMYASPLAWGRDGGVVIIEHVFPDETIAYSVYGHLVEVDDATLPPPLSCIGAGEIVGFVGEARPAPHMHFEIKTIDPNIPGPGYTRDNPLDLGWERPSKFVLNWQTYLQSGYRWRLELADEYAPRTPPVELIDHSLIYLDQNRIRRGTLDGRVLWRAVMEKPVAGLIPYGDGALIISTDGTMQPVNLDGTLSESWSAGVALESPAMLAGEVVLFHTPENSLVALNAATGELRWTLGTVPPIKRWHSTGRVIGLITETGELLTLSPDGELLDRAQLRDDGALDSAPNGDLMVYTTGGLWTVDETGMWVAYLENAPMGGESASFAWSQNNDLYVFDGEALAAYDAARNPLWQIALPDVDGLTSLELHGSNLLLTSNMGHIIAIETSAGGICNLTQIYGTGKNEGWHSLGDDGTLRVALSDQIIGLDWARFLLACTP